MNKHSTVTFSLLIATAILPLTDASAQGGAKPPFSGLVPNATFPSDHTPDLTPKKEKLVNGKSYNAFLPFSYGKSRAMFVYESLDLKIGTGKKITHVGFQADPGLKSVGYKIQLKIYMGKTTATAKNASNTFAKNYFPSTRTQVFGGTSGAVVTLPNLGDSLSPNANRPFVWIKLDTAYAFDTTKNLVIEYEVLSNSNGSKSFNYRLDVAGLVSPIKSLGGGCKDSSGQIPLLKSREAYVGGTWRIELSNAPANSAAIMIFSLGKATVPAIHNGRSDCKIWLDLSPPNFVPFLFFNKTNSSGRCNWSFTIPDNPALLNDLNIYSQVHVDDFFATAKTALSNADHIQFGMLPRATVIYSSGTTATAGAVARYFGLISHFKTN